MKKEFAFKANLDGFGQVKVRESNDLHSLKSQAGMWFHSPMVKAVVVYSKEGAVALYLCKLADGTYLREENK